eukprot:6076561-Pyramimonas_sp.AAC.1
MREPGLGPPHHHHQVDEPPPTKPSSSRPKDFGLTQSTPSPEVGLNPRAASRTRASEGRLSTSACAAADCAS